MAQIALVMIYTQQTSTYQNIAKLLTHPSNYWSYMLLLERIMELAHLQNGQTIFCRKYWFLFQANCFSFVVHFLFSRNIALSFVSWHFNVFHGPPVDFSFFNQPISFTFAPNFRHSRLSSERNHAHGSSKRARICLACKMRSGREKWAIGEIELSSSRSWIMFDIRAT